MASDNVHLLVLIHGMWGNPNHLAEMKRIYQEVRCQDGSESGPDGERIHVLVAETNTESSTYDGIDWGGERVADELYAEVKKLESEGKKVTRFSATGYSLGGLIARYLLGVLQQRDFFSNIAPVNFTTVATPHIGLIRFPGPRSALFAYLGPKLLSRTGEQFYAIDKWSERGGPLLEVMSDPERVFYQALSQFSQIRFYANAVNDITVPYLTAAVETEDPFMDHSFNGIKIEIDEIYSPIIKSYTLPEASFALTKPKKSFKSHFGIFKLRLPPALDYKFPMNILIFAALPILLPVLLSLVIIKLSLDSHSSRSRIKLLEKDKSYANRLIHAIGQLEKSMEDAAVEFMDDPGSVNLRDIEMSSETLADPVTPSAHAELVHHGEQESTPTGPALLKDIQYRMVKSLNMLPGLKKERVFIDPVMNSHAVIVARDVKRFKHHTIGEGVLRHIADHFIV